MADDLRIQATTGHDMINAIEGGAIELYHNTAKKLETTSTGVAITGTITSTGIGQFNDYIDLNTAGNRGKIGYDSNNVYIGSTASAGQIIFKNAITSTDAPQTSGTELMRIDSSGRVGIDVSNMSDYYSTDLVVGCADEGGITLSTTSTSRNYIMFADGASGGTERFRGQISYDHANDQMAFSTAASTAAIIDSSGNFKTNGRGLTVDNVGASWHAINIAESIDNRIAFRITPSRQGQTKGISMGAIGLASSDTGLQAYDTSNNTANAFLINPWGGNVGIGITTGPGTSLHIKDAITNPNTISSNITIPASSNSMMAGPITLNATVTIPSGSSWTIV